MPTSTASIAPAMPPVAGVTRNADAKLNRSSRIGVGSGTTAPLGSATVKVMPWYELSCETANPATFPAAPALVHGSVEP